MICNNQALSKQFSTYFQPQKQRYSKTSECFSWEMGIIESEYSEENMGWESCKAAGAPFLLLGKGEKKKGQLKLCCPVLPWEPHLASYSDWQSDYYFTVLGVIKIPGEFHLEL